jgi:glutamate racemase
LLGVIEPGAAAAVAATRSRRIAVIATEATVRGEAYQAAIHRLDNQAQVRAIATTLFVALAEEGWVNGAVAESIARRYLGPVFDGGAHDSPDTLVLGCTHFPPLAKAIQAVIGPGVTLVDSAATTAAALSGMLGNLGVPAEGPAPRTRFLVTDGVERFIRIGPGFLQQDIDQRDVERIDLAPLPA